MKVVIIYHSGYGHTKIVAEYIRKGASRVMEHVTFLSTLEAQDNFEVLHQADTLVFGSPTYMGTISADFKNFMESTGKFWYSHAKQLEEPNGLASYLGLMTLSDNSTKEVNPPKGLETAELFGERIAQITKQFK